LIKTEIQAVAFDRINAVSTIHWLLNCTCICMLKLIAVINRTFRMLSSLQFKMQCKNSICASQFADEAVYNFLLTEQNKNKLIPL
jgi:hypothetical protein